LKRQFGPPKRVHKKAWADFKQKYDLLNPEPPAQGPSYAESVQEIIDMVPKPLYIDDPEDA